MKKMVFCSNCGQWISDGMKFCPSCGMAAAGTDTGNHSQRKITYTGAVHKCSICGAELPSMVAICPSCGNEIRSQRVHPIIEKFSDELNDCDEEIAAEERSGLKQALAAGSGWTTWETWSKIGWVILNIYTLCIPLGFYRIKRSRPHSPAITKKTAMIENFQVPNEKEVIIEMLYFINSKINGLAMQGSTEENLYWTKQWSAKAKYLYDKACALFPNDQIVSKVYSDMSDKARKAQLIVILKRFQMFGPTIFIIAFVLLMSASGYNRVVADFISGYEKAEFSRFNSFASENGLEGSKIYLECILEEVSWDEFDDGTKWFKGFIRDSNGNRWGVSLQSSQFSPKITFDAIIGEPIIMRGVYQGYSMKYEMPYFMLDEILVKRTRENIAGILKYVS